MVRFYLSILITFFLLASADVFAQPANDACQNAIVISNLNNYCSATKAGTTVGATDDVATTGGYAAAGCWGGGAITDVWYQFVAVASDVTITITGNAGTPVGGTLNRPQVALYSGTCGGTITEMVCGSPPAGQNVIQIYRGGLTVGATYYIRVDGINANTGTFQYCINNYFPVPSPNGDCPTGVVLCDKNNFNVPSVSGAGTNATEMNSAACFQYDPFTGNVESASSWYIFTFGTSGTFNFDITPTNGNDDIDFALFRLPNGVGNCSGKVTVRCEAASCTGSTGLNAGSVDTDEPPGCDIFSDNYVSQVNVTAGQTYALAINNFTSTGNGFNIKFGGTAQFQGPTAVINDNDADDKICVGQAITFTDASTPPPAGTITSRSWNFGLDASTQTSTSANPPAITYSTPGVKTISLTVQSDRGCLVTSQKTITVVSPVANAGVDQTITCTTPGVTIGTAAVAGNTYSWSPAAGLSNANIAQPTATAANTYTLTVTNSGCSSTDAVVIAQNKTAPTANTGADQGLTCAVPTTVIGTAAVGGNTYSWSPAAGLSATNIAQPTASAPNTYTLTVTNTANGCTASDHVIVSGNNTPPTVNAGADKVITCVLPNVVIGTAAVAGNTYSWSPAGGLSATNVAQPTASIANTYTLTVTNTASGCTASDQVIVTVSGTPPSPNAGIDKAITCSTPNVTIGTPALPNESYSWSPAAGLSNASIAQPTASAANTYTLTVTNTTNGCTATDQVMVSQDKNPPTADAGIDKTLTCSVINVTIGTAGVAGNTYSWSPAAGLSATNIAQPTASAAGTYALTVTNSTNGCTATDQVVISQNKIAPTANAGADQVLTCSVNNVTIGTAGVAGNTYSWSPAGGLSATNISQPTASTLNTYTLTVTNTTNGCTASDAVNVTQNLTPPTANAGVDKTITCATPSVIIGTTDVAGNTYSWSPAGGLSATNIAQPSASAANTYTLTVTNTANGCTASDQVIIAQDKNPPIANAGPDKVLTCASLNTTIGTPAIAGNTYSWSPAVGLSASNIAEPIVTAIGTYTLTVMNATNGCTATDQVTLTGNIVKPVADAGVDQTLTCTTVSVTLGTAAVAGNTYSWNPAAGLSNASISQPTTSTPNTYTLTVTNIANGCTSTDAVIISQNITKPVANAGADKVLTCASPSLIIGSATIAGNTYSWNPSSGLNNAAIAQPTVNSPNTYVLTVTNSVNGCTSTDTVIVTKNITQPTANAGADQTLTCTNATFVLGVTAIPGNTYLWNPAAGLNSGTLAQPSVSAPNTYTLTVTNSANGCTATDQVIILQDKTAPAVNAGTDQTFTCVNTNFVLGSASVAGNTYLWSPSAGLSNANIAQPVATSPNTFILTVTKTSNGCSSKDTVVILQNITPPVANAGADKLLTCTVSNVTIGAPAIAGNTYAWNPAAGLSNAGIAQPATAVSNTYSLTVTNNVNGCVSRDTVFVNKNITPPFANAGVDKTLTCAAISVTLGTAAIAGNTYTWLPSSGLNNSNFAQPAANTTGIYTLTVTNNVNGCTATDAAQVFVDTLRPAANAGTDKTLTCINTDFILGSAATSGNTYSWSPVAGLNDATSAQPSVNAPNTFTLTVTTTSNGCTSKDAVVISQDIVKPVANAGADQLLTCTTTNVSIGTIAISGNTYTWNPSTGLSSANTAQPNTSTANTYTLLVTNLSNGCTATDAIIIQKDISKPVANAGGDQTLTCAKTSASLGVPGSAGNTYSWAPASGVSDPSSAQPTTQSPDIYIVTVTKNLNGCVASDTTFIRQNISTSSAIAGADQTLTCTLTSIKIGAPAQTGNTYSWLPVTGLSNANIAQPDATLPGTYTLTVTNNATGCTSSDAVTILQNIVAPVADAGSDKTLTCVVKNVSLGTNAISGNTYAWIPSTGLNAANVAQPTANKTGVYNLTVKNLINGCSAIDSVNVLIDTITPMADAGSDQTFICPHESIIIGAASNSNLIYQWIKSKYLNSNNIAQPTTDSSGVFVLIVEDKNNGCQSLPDTVRIYPKNCDCEFFVPTAFSPNNDGINDLLAPLKDCEDYKDLVFSVYNRWGELVFRSFDLSTGWNGAFNEEFQLDSYVWTLDYYDLVNNKKRFEKGVVTLLK